MIRQIVIGCFALAMCILFNSYATASETSSEKSFDASVRAIPQTHQNDSNPSTAISKHRFGFGFGVVEGDVSAGRQVIMLSTVFAQPLSLHTGLEFSLHHHSTGLALRQSPFGGFNYVASVWNSDICFFTYPVPAWQQFRFAGGISLRHHAAANSLIFVQTSSSGITDSLRVIEYQNAMSMGATLKLDYVLFTFAHSEIALRGQAYIYGAPFSGENRATPFGAAGGAASVQILIQAYF